MSTVLGQPIPLGGEGAVKYNTAQSLTTAQKEQAQKNMGVTWPCNPNLLDNWYFCNPVNQRGQTSYTGAEYTIDRWIKTGSNILGATVADGYVHIERVSSGANPIFRQLVETPNLYLGKPLTVSIMYRTNADISGTYGARVTFDRDLSSQVVEGINLSASLDWTVASKTMAAVDIPTASTLDVAIQIGSTVPVGNYVDVLAAKLEIGTGQTLAHQDAEGNWVLNEIPNYADQLARCQRYALTFTEDIRAVTVTANKMTFFVPTPVTMRTTPTLSGAATVKGINTQTTDGFSVEVANQRKNGVMITATKTSHGLTDAIIYLENVLLSADL